MDVNNLAGLCLILLGVVNVLHEVVIRLRDSGAPGFVSAVVTALFITLGAVLIIRKPIVHGRKTNGPSAAD